MPGKDESFFGQLQGTERSKKTNKHVLKMMGLAWRDYKIAAINIFRCFKMELSNTRQ